LATTNPDKLRELSSLLGPLGIPLVGLGEFPGAVPIVEDGTTLAENARRKAAGYALQLGEWVLADDTGLEVDALAGAPGVRSARYAGDHADMAANRARLLADLAHVHDSQRSGRFVCCLAVAAPSGEVVAEAAGVCPGSLRRAPAGMGGFGYDALFEVEGSGKTLAELDAAATGEWGHRGKAVRALLRSLRAGPPAA
jgi:XTP/dITP diphosphohydrolase